ncbi:hypothetical protein CVV38_04255 [Candidatus Peregrinibacteria bacterium HGW-Peregrinibacteria-1]|jgi:Tfp pilus assembly protein PilO|nr:MAG: hypothetical protein CVV38_04255 [Candidatus Peregrinibacteria bacterium HGW-Peregrinibacteria-1]
MLDSQNTDRDNIQNGGKHLQKSFSMMLGVLLVLAALAGYLFYLKGVSSEVDSLKNEIKVGSERVTLLKAELDNYKETESILNVTSDVAKELALSAIPLRLEQDEIIRDVMTISRSNDIELNSISFSKGSTEHEGVNSLRINAGFEGNYPDLIAFLRGLESNERFFRVNSTSVQVQNSDGVGLSRVMFSLSIEAYFQ